MELSLVAWYILFALTTSIVSIYELISPVLEQLAKNNPTDMMVRNKYTSYFVFFMFGIMFAPLVVLPCIIPSMGDTMRVSLLEALEG